MTPQTRGATLWLACLILPGACGRGGAESEADAETAVSVRTAQVVSRPFIEVVRAIGVVVARPGRVALLSAPGPTRVARVLVSSGQRVAAGQSLVELEQAQFQASAQSAEAALAVALRARERAERLAEAGILPRKELDQATAELEQARANAVTARRSAELSVLRAPLAGVVTRLNAVLGASVDANQPLVEVADPTAFDVQLNVTPAEAGRIRPGAAVELSAGQEARGEALGSGAVLTVAANVDSASLAVMVRARIAKPRRPLRIGETVFGRVAVGTRERALAVPSEALVPADDKFVVFVVDSASVAHARSVAVGASSDSLTEVTAGLTEGERIVTYGAYGVRDSGRVVSTP